jgi:RNA 3'-terminal phosphate cyclase (ATP)
MIRIRAGTICIKAPSFWAVREVIVPTLHIIELSRNIRIEPGYEQGWHTEYVTTPGLFAVWIKPLQEPLPAFRLSQRGSIVQITATTHTPSEDLELFREILTRELNDALNDKCENLFHASQNAQTCRDTSYGPSPGVDIRMLVSNLPSQYHLLLTARAEDPPGYLGYEQVYLRRHVFPEHAKEGSEDTLLYLTRVCIRGLSDQLSH